jgi:hypothetical protein
VCSFGFDGFVAPIGCACRIRVVEISRGESRSGSSMRLAFSTKTSEASSAVSAERSFETRRKPSSRLGHCLRRCLGHRLGHRFGNLAAIQLAEKEAGAA